MLRLAPEDYTKPIDFRQGRWGHRLHSGFFRQEEPANFIQAWLDRRNNSRRYSFLCHSQDTPVVGRMVIWTAKDADRKGAIYRIEYMRDPDDTYKLFVLVEGKQ